MKSADVYIADVRSNLAAGMRIVYAGNRIVLDEEGSYIENKASGDRISIRHENGCFMFDLWVPATRKTKPSTGTNTKTAKRWKKTQEENDDDEMEVSLFMRQEEF